MARSSIVASAREGARRPDGKFGSYHLEEADEVDLSFLDEDGSARGFGDEELFAVTDEPLPLSGEPEVTAEDFGKAKPGRRITVGEVSGSIASASGVKGAKYVQDDQGRLWEVSGKNGAKRGLSISATPEQLSRRTRIASGIAASPSDAYVATIDPMASSEAKQYLGVHHKSCGQMVGGPRTKTLSDSVSSRAQCFAEMDAAGKASCICLEDSLDPAKAEQMQQEREQAKDTNALDRYVRQSTGWGVSPTRKANNALRAESAFRDGRQVVTVSSPVTTQSQEKTAKHLREQLRNNGARDPIIEFKPDEQAESVLRLPKAKAGESLTFYTGSKDKGPVKVEAAFEERTGRDTYVVRDNNGKSYRLRIETNAASGVGELTVEHVVDSHDGGKMWSPM